MMPRMRLVCCPFCYHPVRVLDYDKCTVYWCRDCKIRFIIEYVYD